MKGLEVMPLSNDQKLYEEILKNIKNEIHRARNIDQVSHVDLLNAVTTLINTEIMNIRDYHHL